MTTHKVVFIYIVSAFVIIMLIWQYYEIEEDETLLSERGKKTYGVIVKKLHRRGGIDIKYRFLVGGKEFEAWKKTNADIIVGDTVEILFLPEDPAISTIMDLKK